MKSVSFHIENLCVPCNCVCRHCLLSAAGKSTGVELRRGEVFARKIHGWLKENRPDLQFMYYIGYCNDLPELPEHIDFLRSVMPGFDFLQFNGMKLRSSEETDNLLRTVRVHGINRIDLTFYGVGAYHDRFAGRKGDFDYLLSILRKANETGLTADASVCLIRENMDQMDTLFDILSRYQVGRIYVFLPHAQGRGEKLAAQRLTKEEFEALPSRVKKHFSTIPHLTEAEWVRRGVYPMAQARHLGLALTRENIERLESMDPGRIISGLEAMDEAYYAAIPPAEELAKTYGRPENQQIFRFRDMYLQWQKRYIADHPLNVTDMNDQSHSFSVRSYDERI